MTARLARVQARARALAKLRAGRVDEQRVISGVVVRGAAVDAVLGEWVEKHRLAVNGRQRGKPVEGIGRGHAGRDIRFRVHGDGRRRDALRVEQAREQAVLVPAVAVFPGQNIGRLWVSYPASP